MVERAIPVLNTGGGIVAGADMTPETALVQLMWCSHASACSMVWRCACESRWPASSPRDEETGTMTHGAFTVAEFQERLRRVQKVMAERGLEAFIVTRPQNVYYLTGFRSMGTG